MKGLSIIYSIVIIAFACVDMHGKGLDGTYSDGMKFIEISKDTLKIMTASYEVYDCPNYSKLTCNAICKFNMISKSFLEINSIRHPFEEAFGDCKITRAKISPNDTAAFPIVNFVFPNITEDVKVEVYSHPNYYSAISEDGHCQIIINKYRNSTFKDIDFNVAPLNYNISNLEAQYFGVMFYWYAIGIDCQQDEIITIELPSVTEGLFEQYYIKGEYVRIKSDGLVWRGDFYKKLN